MLIILLGVVLSVAYLTLLERKLMGAIQRRIGPNQVGYLGLLQPLTDGIKLLLKESIFPLHSSKSLFLIAPFISFYLALSAWLFLPLDHDLFYSDLPSIGILLLIAITELSIFGVLYAGWTANSKYPFFGAIRSTAQMISYSLALGSLYLLVSFVVGDISLPSFMLDHSRYLSLLPLLLVFFISALAETNRAPFDLPEAESELVAGFFTEHSAVAFVFFFLAEYTSIIAISTLFFVLFFGLSLSLPLLILFIWVRALLPRFRFDQLLSLGWLSLLPLLMASLLFLPSFLFSLSF